MKILITGAGGQLGKEWVQTCEQQGIEYIAATSNDLDITDPDKLDGFFEQHDPDLLVNCAAYTKVDQAESEPELAHLINATAVGSLAQKCREHTVKLIHYSTDYVFSGSSEDQKRLAFGYSEDHPKAPLNVYGKSKSEGEDLIEASGVDHLILRVSWLCGKFGNNFIHTMLRLGSERDELNVVHDQLGCPAFAGPVVDQTLQLIRSSSAGVFHLGSEGLISWYDFAKTIFEKKKMNVSVNPVTSEEFKTTARRPQFSKLNTQKAEQCGVTIPNWETALNEVLNDI